MSFVLFSGVAEQAPLLTLLVMNGDSVTFRGDFGENGWI